MKRRKFLIGATSSVSILLSNTAKAAEPCAPILLGGSPSAPCPTGDSGDSTLSDIIGGMGVNSWAQLPATWPGGVTDFFAPSPSSESITDFAHQGFYDPVRRKMVFVGAGYGGQCGYVVYDEATDSWSRTVFSENIIHSWDHVAYDASRGYLYFSGELGGTLRRIDIDTGTLSYDGSLPWHGSVDTYGMEYWPSKDGIIVSNQSGDAYFRPHGGSFSLLTSNLQNVGYDSMLSHNPVRDVMYWGGGNGTEEVFKEIATDGAVTSLSNAFYLYVGSTVANCDPVTGDLIVRHTAGGSPEMSKYVHGSGWSTISTSIPSYLTGKRGSFDAAVNHELYPSRGVIMYVTTDVGIPSVGEVWLYRYS